MSDAGLIDTHVHFWDLAATDRRYPWLAAGVAHPVLGDIEAIKCPRYDLAAFWAEARFSGVTSVVHVEADARSEDPVAETRWLEASRQANGEPSAMVVRARLASPDLEATLEEQCRYPGVRGIRDFDLMAGLADPTRRAQVEAGLDLLQQRRLVCDVDCAWEAMETLREAAESRPGLVMVLEHFGYPRARDRAYFEQWRAAVRSLAVAPGVRCKISGMGMTDRRWTVESLRPWVETCLESFGPARCVFGSNWPVDRIGASYDAYVDAFLKLVDSLSASEREAVCRGNAIGIYRLETGVAVE